MCNLCNYKILENNLESVFQYIELQKENLTAVIHINKYNIMHTGICKSLNEIIISNNKYIIFDEKSNIYICNICNCNIFGKENINLHTQGNFHKNNIIKVNGANISDKNNLKTQFNKIYYCLFCKIFIKNTTVLQCHTMLHLHEKLNIPQETDIITFNFKNTNLTLKCLLCDIFLSNIDELSNHLETTIHLNRLLIFSRVKEDIILDGLKNVEIDINNFKNIESELKKNNLDASLCIACDLAMFEGNINEHIKGKRHINSLKNFETKINESQEINIVINTSNLYICFICKKSFSTAPQLLKHYQENDHKTIIKCFLMIYNNFHIDFINFENKEIIQCVLCKINMNDCKQAIEHIIGKKHNIQLKSFCFKQNDELNNKLKNLTLNTKNIHSSESSESNTEKINDVKKKIVQIDHHKLEKNKLKFPKQIKERKMTKNKNYSLKNLIKHFGKTFIRFCIDSGTSNIYNIHKDKVDLIKFGFTLIFPLQQKNKFICFSCNKKILNKQLLFEHLQDNKHIQNLKNVQNKKVLNKKSKFSQLKLAEFCMRRRSKKNIKCYACNSEIKNKSTIIDLHIKKDKHLLNYQLWKEQSIKILEEFLMIFNNAWYYAQVYICAVCQKKFDLEIKFAEHLTNFTHLNQVNCMKNDGIILEFHICPICVTYWYGKSDSYNLHCENLFHKYFVERGDLIVPNMSKFAVDLLNNVDQNINILLNESNKVILEQTKELDVLKAIEETVKCIYPNAKSYLLGSRLSYIGFPDSDLDIFLDCDNLYYECKSEEKMKKYLISVIKYFKKDANIWIVNEIILDTRVPIIKLRHVPTGLKTDISFLNGLAVEKSKLIRYYNDAYCVCRNLMLYLKKWFTLSQIPGSRGIPTYAISWYVIFYLQVKGILPSVFELIKLENKSKIIGGWECGFHKKVSVASSDLNFKDLIQEFFSYYADFDYKLNVICPYLGKIIKKNLFAFNEKLPIEMEIYKQKVIQNLCTIFQYYSPMCIQDPVDLSQNITKHITKLQLQSFQKYCHESALKISN